MGNRGDRKEEGGEVRTVEEEIATVKKLMKEANIDSLRKQRAVDHHDWLV